MLDNKNFKLSWRGIWLKKATAGNWFRDWHVHPCYSKIDDSEFISDAEDTKCLFTVLCNKNCNCLFRESSQKYRVAEPESQFTLNSWKKHRNLESSLVLFKAPTDHNFAHFYASRWCHVEYNAMAAWDWMWQLFGLCSVAHWSNTCEHGTFGCSLEKCNYSFYCKALYMYSNW